MAYSTSTPPAKISFGVIDSTQVGNQWVLSGTDAQATVAANGYITNGGQLGMRVNDVLFYSKTDTFITVIFTVIAVNATTGAVNLSTGTAIS